MKYLLKFMLFAIVIGLAACNKVDNLPFYSSGSQISATSSVTTVAATAADTAKTVVSFNWSNPNYSNKGLKTKYIVQFDSAGKNFIKAYSDTLYDTLSKGYTGKDFNLVLYKLGLNIGNTYDLDVRVISSYANNNEIYNSNTMRVNTTFQGGTSGSFTSSVAGNIPIASTTLANEAVKFSWTNTNYYFNTGLSSQVTTYMVQMDVAGANFSSTKLQTFPLDTAHFFSYSQKDLNTTLLKLGFLPTVPINLEFRLVSMLNGATNTKVNSSIISLSATPVNKPAVDVPVSGKLFIVGDATAGGWGNPVPTPSQEFTKIDSVTYGGIFDLVGGKEYLLLPVNGDWSNKYSVANKQLSGLSSGGAFGYNFNDNFPGPATSGKYKIMIDFQTGNFTVTPFTAEYPANLFIVGSATAGAWSNPVPVPSQQFTLSTSGLFELSLPLTGGQEYLLLPVNGDWSHKFAVQDNSIPSYKLGGTFGYDAPKNFPGPDVTGNYKVSVNFLSNTYKVTKL
jgi:hypothetical protein